MTSRIGRLVHSRLSALTAAAVLATSAVAGVSMGAAGWKRVWGDYTIPARLTSLGIPVIWDAVPGGGHDWTDWNAELTKAFPMLMSAIGA